MDPSSAARILLRRRRMRESLVGFAQSIQIPGAPVGGDDSELFSPVGSGMALHHKVMCEAIQRCIETDYGRLILMLPPGAAKSTYASSVAPIWAMAKWPGFQTILTSYGTDLAKKHGRKGRAIARQPVFVDAFGTTLSKDTKAAELWRLDNGAEYMAGGILSGITGARADLVVGDDLVAGQQEAMSKATRAATWDAWESDALSRLKPKGSVVLLGTRWHPLDPIGMLLPADYAGQSGPVLCSDGMVWNVLCIPAEAEREDDPLGRRPGEMLWPEWFTEEHWKPWRAKARIWASLFQQRPNIAGGDKFKAEWIKWYDEGEHPEWLNVYGFSDYGAPSEDTEDPDFTEHGVFGMDEDGNLWALDWFFGQVTTNVGVDAFLNLAAMWKPRRWWNEKGPIYNAIKPEINRKRRERGVRVGLDALPSSVNKVARAESFFSMAEAGKVYLPRTPWARRLAEQLCAFPVLAHDDAVDVASLAGRALDGMAFAYVPMEPKDSSLRPFSVAWLEYQAPKVGAGGKTM